MTETPAQQPEVYELPPAILENLANARATLRFIKLALVGLSLEVVDDAAAADVRALSGTVEQVVVQLRSIEQIAIPKHGEAVH